MVSHLNQYEPDVVSIPGETIAEMLNERSMTQKDFAVRMGRPEKTISEIINGKTAITYETAMQLEKVLGISASFWINRENNYRAYLARAKEEQRLIRDKEWLEEIPISDMAKKGWIRKVKDISKQIEECLKFFGVASVSQWRAIYDKPQTSYRKSKKLEASPGAIAAWLRQGEILAKQINCEKFRKSKFKKILRKAKQLTTKPTPKSITNLRELCASAGVALVYVPELKGCRCWGAARWLPVTRPTKPLIQLSLRYKTDDHFWFTFFHEAGHILSHPKKTILDGDGNDHELENEANAFSENYLIPPNDYQELLTYYQPFSKDGIELFAHKKGIAPGVIVGRLQHGLKVKV